MMKRIAALHSQIPLANYRCLYYLFAIMAKQKKTGEKKTTGAALGFEATLWAMADKQRGHMDAAEYKHVVLGLIFLKYISDAFEEKHTALVEEKKKAQIPRTRRVHSREHLLGAQRSPLDVHPGQGKAANHRQDHR